MNRFHIAIATNDVDATIEDYSVRLGASPCSWVAGEYALWRTDTLNVSVRRDAFCGPGTLRHLGWEDERAPSFEQDTDVNGIAWERFTAAQQAQEINDLWPDADYCASE
jgi:hypothetical protein